MKRLLLVFLTVAAAGIASAQYISEVYEYCPAPGQYINVDPWGTPSAMQSVIGGINGSMTLGTFGGYVVFGFENPVENDPLNPYGIDFSVFGNPYDDWSEPAAVYVMKDQNQNGVPDDQWYLLAGSDYFFSTTKNDYCVTYSNPGGENAIDIPWSDNQGNTGVVEVNEFHSQPWYPLIANFPEIPSDHYSLEGHYVKIRLDETNPASVKSYCRAFGYADNYKRSAGTHLLPDNPYTQALENGGGDAFDISWAVDSLGNYVDLDAIDFVKVQSAAMGNGGWLGEISTEVCGAVDIAPDQTVSGEMNALVVGDLPVVCTSPTWQLEYAAFSAGRLKPDATVEWSVSMKNAFIDGDNILHIPASGEITLTAISPEIPGVMWSQTFTAMLSNGLPSLNSPALCRVYPVPAKDFVHVFVDQSCDACIYNIDGTIVEKISLKKGENTLSILNYKSGLLLLKAELDGAVVVRKIVVQ